MSNRHYIAIIYWLLARRFGLLDLQRRAAAIVKKLEIKPVNLCTCVLNSKWKGIYNSHVNDARNGKPRFRTHGSL